ncbi:UDP-N-acetylmuramate dehydrogenase [Alginatibacterium sediminis]|uniref:UDP-N-acetylenolpyruvoylglucosamine reductase n=1 Tax=Alginatibacterium sediminis TaxID=2164068 RepID=A0A420EL46_9ALTE|nr:UDP-N-acetylmuramate dehydrogenase [Alginatibacterium sediminis]RKF21403.1 UDP-N-acetylmuramate dehydrogenase [Alginatibacterium sediminis]
MNSLAKYNSFGLECKAEKLYIIDSTTRLNNAVELLKPDRPLPLIIGEGSNLLLTCNLEIDVWLNRILKREVIELEHSWILRIGAGENWHELVQWCITQGIYGLENLALIPGTVGAAPVQNIGAYGVEVCKFVNRVRYTDLYDGVSYQLSAEQCQFDYRDSIFKSSLKGRAVITEVELMMPKKWHPVCDYGPLRDLGPIPTAQAIFDKVCETRRAKLPDPKVLGNAGSFFKNPIVDRQTLETLLSRYPDAPHFATKQDDETKLAAGWLIDQCGLKGYTVGGARVHEQQALVLVNVAQASASDVLQLAKYVQLRVQERFGVKIEPEVRFINALGECDAMDCLARLSGINHAI